MFIIFTGLLTMQLNTNFRLVPIMVELGLVDYFVMGEAVGIVATFVAAFYYSRKQMQKLSVDIETKVLSDLDEKMNDLTHMAVEKPQLMRIVSYVDSDLTEEIAYTYHLLHTFAHAYHMYRLGAMNVIILSTKKLSGISLGISSLMRIVGA